MTEVDNLAGLVAEFESACGTFTAYRGQQAEQKFASAKHALLTALASLSARNQELDGGVTASRKLLAMREKERDLEKERADSNYDYFRDSEAKNAQLMQALRRIRSACDEPLSYGRSNLANKVAELADAALSPTDAVGEKDPLSAEERDTLQSLLNAMGFGRSFDALKKLMSALPASAPQNGDGK